MKIKCINVCSDKKKHKNYTTINMPINFGFTRVHCIIIICHIFDSTVLYYMASCQMGFFNEIIQMLKSAVPQLVTAIYKVDWKPVLQRPLMG